MSYSYTVCVICCGRKTHGLRALAITPSLGLFCRPIATMGQVGFTTLQIRSRARASSRHLEGWWHAESHDPPPPQSPVLDDVR